MSLLAAGNCVPGAGEGRVGVKHLQNLWGAAEGLGEHRMTEELRLKGPLEMTQGDTKLCHPTLPL